LEERRKKEGNAVRRLEKTGGERSPADERDWVDGGVPKKLTRLDDGSGGKGSPFNLRARGVRQGKGKNAKDSRKQLAVYEQNLDFQHKRERRKRSSPPNKGEGTWNDKRDNP